MSPTRFHTSGASQCANLANARKNSVEAGPCTSSQRRQLLFGGAALLGAAAQQSFGPPQVPCARVELGSHGREQPTCSVDPRLGIAVSRADDDDTREVTYLDIKDLDTLTSAQEDILEKNMLSEELLGVPDDFPIFIREKFDVKVVGDAYRVDRSGLIYKDYVVGTGPLIRDGDKVFYHYRGWLESGKIVGTSQGGKPIEMIFGKTSLVQGVEIGMRQMRNGGLRRMVVSPQLGPPTGPQSFFLPKQVQVFDIEVVNVIPARRGD